ETSVSPPPHRSHATPHLVLHHALQNTILSFMPPPPAEIYTLSLHDALPICHAHRKAASKSPANRSESMSGDASIRGRRAEASPRSEEHTSELQSRGQLVCRLLLEKKKGMWTGSVHGEGLGLVVLPPNVVCAR